MIDERITHRQVRVLELLAVLDGSGYVPSFKRLGELLEFPADSAEERASRVRKTLQYLQARGWVTWKRAGTLAITPAGHEALSELKDPPRWPHHRGVLERRADDLALSIRTLRAELHAVEKALASY